jgi:uncharacterized RDD family membrane protein YckC
MPETLVGEATRERVEYACPRCDGVVAAEDVVCPHCGQALEAVAAADERVVRVEEAVVPAVAYAGWWRRFGAWLVDWTLLWTLLIGVPTVAMMLIAPGEGASYETGEAAVVLVSFVLIPIVAFAYFAFFNGRGQTLGKRLFGITVVDQETGERIGFGRGAGREGIRLACVTLFYVPFFIDGLRPLWNERHQSWHDSVARSIVVRARR